MNNNPSKDQKMAMDMVCELTDNIVENNNLRGQFCSEIRDKILSKSGINIAPYREILINVFSDNPKIHKLSNYTLRNATWNILKVLTEEGVFTKEERSEIGKKVKQGGGTRGVIKSQEAQNLQALSNEEKGILNEIYTIGNGYKRGSTRNIKKICSFLEIKTGIKRNSVSAIKQYLHNLNQETRRESTKRDDPEEISTLKQLFIENYKIGQKLPIAHIVSELNKKHKNNRTKNSVECYIRNYIKTPDQKEEKGELWSDKEKETIHTLVQDIKQNWKNYSYQDGKRKGSYNRSKIYESYKILCPESKRTIRAVEHQIKKIKKSEQ